MTAQLEAIMAHHRNSGLHRELLAIAAMKVKI